MGDAEMPAPAEIKFSDKQLDAFADLLVRFVTRGNISWLANSVLGPQAEQQAGNEVGDPASFARRIVQLLDDAKRIPEAIRMLCEQAHSNSYLMVGLKRLLNGEDLPDDAAMQAFVNDYEPFLSSKIFQDQFPKVLRTVCAIALGAPTNSIVGSGFLIAPDLVMTNFHVLETFLNVDSVTRKVTANGLGNQIFFFFDYLSAPTPTVPPDTKLAITAADDWLVYGREMLSGDGTSMSKPIVNKEYDYAIVRLARPVGSLSARKGGGGIRGWLKLPTDGIDVLGKDKRIIVFQHPQKAPQQWDIGEFKQLDQTTTRVWYSVSTAHGSSGGAAVDTEGKLFALHNAEVMDTAAPADRKLNQGVRIDKIFEDLAEYAPAVLETPEEKEDLLTWSLNDDLQNSSPIIGRTKFRGDVREMSTLSSERVLVITGSAGSGRQFSIELLRQTLGLRVPVIVFSPADLQSTEPAQFLKNIVNDLGLLGLGGHPIPAVLPTENISRWLRLDLPKWLLERLSEDEQRNPAKYPAWIVINTVMPKGERLVWADNLKDCVAALVGAHDSSQPANDVPQLRWLFLATSADALPIGGVKHLEEDLSNYTTYEQDFADCVALARFAIDKQAPDQDDVTLKGFARFLEQVNGNKVPLRKFLADSVREIIRTA